MKKENDEITDLFRSRLMDAEMTVREGFWEELSGDLTIDRRHRRVIFFRVAAAASVLLVLALSSAAFWFFSPKEEIGEAFTKLSASGVGDLEGDRVNQSFTPAISEPLQQKAASVIHSLLAGQTNPEEDDSATVSMSFSFSVTTTTRVDHGSETPDRVNNAWKAGNGTEMMASANEQEPSSSGSISVPAGKNSSWAVKPSVGMALPAEEGTYRMPVTVGVTVEKRLNNQLGIESGLQYSNLRAASGQGLHYVGIPVKMNIYLAETKNLDVYASVGGVADKCIAGAPRTDFKNEPIQLALTAGVGMNYKINERLAVFAEPGVTHHFKTDSQLETIRTKRATNFNLICGLRMTY